MKANGELKIENKMPPVSRRGRDEGEFTAFLETVPKLKVGQSFIIKNQASNYRMASSIARVWLGIQLTIQREGDGWRVGRVA